jgi:hypothetical protein
MGVVMTNHRIRPTLKLGLLAGAVLVTALIATTGTASAERPAAGHWEGTQGVSFDVEHHDSTVLPTLVTRIAWNNGPPHFPHSALTKDDEFESCIAHLVTNGVYRHTCVKGQFTSHHHASGAVTMYLVAAGHDHHHGRQTHRWEWTASMSSD